MKIYKFIGQDGSLGLIKGHLYKIDIKRKWFSKGIIAYIYIGRIRVITCPYSNIKTFYQNWEVYYDR